MRTTLLLASLVASTALAAPAMAQTPPAQPAPSAQPGAPAAIPAADFVNRAALGSMFEIQTSQLALNRTQNAQIRGFAQRMIDDHTKATEALKAAAPGQTLPQSLDPSRAALLQTLQGANGPDFDRRYVRQQVNAHQESVQLHEAFARTGDNPQLKTFAQQTLPILQQHLKSAQELRQAIPPDQVGTNQPAGAAGDVSRILVQQTAPQVRVDQAAPQVMVQQPQPNVTVNQAQPQITVRQPQPTVTVDIPQPEIIVRMPQPDVNVAMAQPQVQVRQPQPQVQVVQPQAQPQVQVQRDQAQVTVRPAEGQPNVQVMRRAGEPEVRYERAEPRVVVNQAQGQPNVRFERVEGQPQAQAQPAAQGDPNQARALRERINGGEVEATGAVSAAGAQTRPIAVRQLEDMDVYNARGESLGEVDRVIVDAQNRQFLVVGSGGFLGLGRERVAFPMDRFWMRGDRLVIRGVTEQDIEAMDDYRSQFDSMRRLAATDQANLRIFE